MFSEADRNNRLNVHYVLDTISWADSEIPVLLDGKADHTGNRVLSGFPRFFQSCHVGRGLELRGLCRLRVLCGLHGLGFLCSG